MYLFCISCKYLVATIKVPTLVHDLFEILLKISVDEMHQNMLNSYSFVRQRKYIFAVLQ